jgi:hypothetical protein
MERVKTLFYLHCRIGDHEICVELSEETERLTKYPPGLNRKERDLLCDYVIAQDKIATEAGTVRQEHVPAPSARGWEGGQRYECYHSRLGEIAKPEWMK